MSVDFLLGVPGKLKTLLDRVTAAVATASALQTVDDHVDTINSRVTAAVATASALQTVDNHVDTILARVTAAVATATALQTVDDNVDDIKTAIGAQDPYLISNHQNVSADTYVTLLNISGGGGFLTYIHIRDSSGSTTDIHTAKITVDGGTAKELEFNDPDMLYTFAVYRVRFNSSLKVEVKNDDAGDFWYTIAYTLDT